MKAIYLTCPFTGVGFECTEFADKTIIAYHPITHEEIRLSYNPSIKKYMIDPKAFKRIETISVSIAAEILDVSIPRITALCSNGQIPYIVVNGKKQLIYDDVIKYKRNRKNGRPKKESDDNA